MIFNSSCSFDKYYGTISKREKVRELVTTEKRNPLRILRSMLHYKRLVCLTHPVLVEFLKHKWNLYGKKFLILRLLLTLLLVILLSAFIVSSTPPRDFVSRATNVTDQVNFTSTKGKPAGNSLRIVILIICSCAAQLSFFTIYFVIRLRHAFAQILPVISFSTCSIANPL